MTRYTVVVMVHGLGVGAVDNRRIGYARFINHPVAVEICVQTEGFDNVIGTIVVAVEIAIIINTVCIAALQDIAITIVRST